MSKPNRGFGQEEDPMTSRFLKLAMVALVVVCFAAICSAPSFAAEKATPKPMPTTAQAPFGPKHGTWKQWQKSDVQNTMTKVGQDVWHAQISGASAQHMEQLFLEGQRLYFKGDYDGAMHKFLAAERITQKYPNDITGRYRK